MLSSSFIVLAALFVSSQTFAANELKLVKRAGQGLPIHYLGEYGGSPPYQSNYLPNERPSYDASGNCCQTEYMKKLDGKRFDEDKYLSQWHAEPYDVSQDGYPDNENDVNQSIAMSKLSLDESDDSDSKSGNRKLLSKKKKKIHAVSKKGSSGGGRAFFGGSRGGGSRSSPAEENPMPRTSTIPYCAYGNCNIGHDHAEGPSSGHKKKHLTGGQIAGITIGAVVGCAAAAMGAVCCCQYCQEKNSHYRKRDLFNDDAKESPDLACNKDSYMCEKMHIRKRK